jgi:thioredoxin reductase (NADPH)
MNHPPHLLDCLVVGGGAGGLTAATYLARFRRNVLVVDAGASRLAWIPTTHNYPGFPEGIHGPDLWRRLHEQALRYGAPSIRATVASLERDADGIFTARVGKDELRARTVVLATGAEDVAPPMDWTGEAVTCSCVRYCPVCDGHEAIGKKVAVLGTGSHGFREALFIRHFADELTLFTFGEKWTFTPEERAELEDAGIRVVEQPVTADFDQPNKQVLMRLADGSVEQYATLYSALGLTLRTNLAEQLGAQLDENGEVVCDAHMHTTVDGLYCVGDIAPGLNQICIATGHAAVAATAIHNRLREPGNQNGNAPL